MICQKRNNYKFKECNVILKDQLQDLKRVFPTNCSNKSFMQKIVITKRFIWTYETATLI